MAKNKLANRKSIHPGGFTLLELVMVLVIIILMSGLMIPHILDNIDASAHHRERAKLISWTRWAQSQAVKEQRPYQIEFYTILNPPCGYTVRRYNGVTWDEVENVVFEEGVILTFGTRFPSDILIFDQFGFPNAYGYLVLRNSNWENANYIVDELGPVQMQT